MPAFHKIRHLKKRAFLASYAELGNVTAAAEIAGVDRTAHYQWLAADEHYARAFADAEEQAADRLEKEARRRAVEGWEEPIVYQGVVTGKVRKYSDTLLIFLLKGALPEKYKDRKQTDVTSGGEPVRFTIQIDNANDRN